MTEPLRDTSFKQIVTLRLCAQGENNELQLISRHLLSWRKLTTVLSFSVYMLRYKCIDTKILTNYTFLKTCHDTLNVFDIAS